VRDCHGDLRADAVYVREDGGICVMDCIEFNDRIRYGDVAGDIGFLAMDLEQRGHRGLADELMGAYLGDAGDETLPLVLRYYKTYRAFIRGKVEAMRSAEKEVPEEARGAAEDAARRYFALASDYAAESYPQNLLYMVGLSGTGKSYLADALACRIGAVVLRTDVLRGRTATKTATAFGGGRYAAVERERVYERMRASARRHLALGRSVILDATHLSRADRDAARALARDAGVPALAVEVRAADELVRERISRRTEEGASASEATWEVYTEQKRRMEPLAESEGTLVGVDASQAVTAQIGQVLPELG
jgi:predicted kinase